MSEDERSFRNRIYRDTRNVATEASGKYDRRATRGTRVLLQGLRVSDQVWRLVYLNERGQRFTVHVAASVLQMQLQRREARLAATPDDAALAQDVRDLRWKLEQIEELERG